MKLIPTNEFQSKLSICWNKNKFHFGNRYILSIALQSFAFGVGQIDFATI